jgi:predicted dithiol-disulfide oxidoreductase (DUF899 family)
MSGTEEQPVVSAEDWEAARSGLMAAEKALTVEADRVAALRRQMPWRRVERDYRFVTDQGAAGLADLFDGRRQLIVYHHMLRADDPAPCSGCSLVIDQLPHLAHLKARDTSLVVASVAPMAQIAAFKARMGWTVPWVEADGAFGDDMGHGPRGPGFSVFIRRGAEMFHSYGCSSREVERATTVWGLLDMTPMGRQEEWQDAPGWVPQGAAYRWWRLHDSYGAEG